MHECSGRFAASRSATLAASVKDHFYFLGTYAIAGFLLGLGGFSLMLSWRPPSVEAATFAGTMVLLWLARFGLELAYPVNLSIFGVPRPHPVLVVVLITLVALYAKAFIGQLRARWRAQGMPPPRQAH